MIESWLTFAFVLQPTHLSNELFFHIEIFFFIYSILILFCCLLLLLSFHFYIIQILLCQVWQKSQLIFFVKLSDTSQAKFHRTKPHANGPMKRIIKEEFIIISNLHFWKISDQPKLRLSFKLNMFLSWAWFILVDIIEYILKVLKCFKSNLCCDAVCVAYLKWFFRETWRGVGGKSKDDII